MGGGLRAVAPRRKRVDCRRRILNLKQSFKGREAEHTRSQELSCDQKRYYRLMARKLISLALVLSVLQLTAFAADCDLNCILTHTHHHHPTPLPQSHHEHHSGHMHSAHAADAVDSINPIPQCHQGMNTACSSDCVSKTSASGTAVSAARHVLVCHTATSSVKAAITFSPVEHGRQLFLPSSSNSRSPVLRI